MDSRERLQKRINGVTKDDVMLGFLVSGALEAMRQSLGREPVNAIWKQVAGDSSLFAFFKYPVSWLMETLRQASTLKGAPQDFDHFLRQTAQGMVMRSLDTPLGKTMALLGKSSPHKLISSAVTAVMTMFSFSQSRYDETGPRSCTVTVTEQHLGPVFYGTCVETTVNAMTKEKCTVTPEPRNDSGTDFVLSVRW